MREHMHSHLQLVTEKFEQQIEMNTFMMAHFTEQMEEQVDKSMQLVQQIEARQTDLEVSVQETLKTFTERVSTPHALLNRSESDFRSQKSQVLKELKEKQKHQREILELLRSELQTTMKDHSTQLLDLQERVESTNKSFIEKLFSQSNHLGENLQQNVQMLEQKIEAKEIQHAAHHALLQSRFDQNISHASAPLLANIARLEQVCLLFFVVWYNRVFNPFLIMLFVCFLFYLFYTYSIYYHIQHFFLSFFQLTLCTAHRKGWRRTSYRATAVDPSQRS
jgi:hypothetical protein